VATHRKSIIKQTIDRFDGLMAINESRGKAKEAAKEAGEYQWAFTTGRIHSFKTRSVYQEHTLRLVTWARATYQIKDLAHLDARADELATTWLQQRVASGKSPYTLQLERAALRMFFSDRALASTVTIPLRTRETITRSRGPKVGDMHIQLANWQPLITFLRATGLRRQEARDLHCRDIHQHQDSSMTVHVASGKGGKIRDVPVLPGREQDVLATTVGRAPEEKVFVRIPTRIDVHSYRREYAQALYLHYAPPGSQLPPATGRLRPQDYDRAAAERVSWALGHKRIDVIARHYLR
jgi:hypothetical protein